MKKTGVSERGRSRLTRFRRGLGVLILVACMPACGSYKKSTTYTAPAVGGPPGTLLSDSFFPFPPSAGTNWTAPSDSGGGTATSQYVVPEYHALMQAPSPRATAAFAFMRTNAAFNSHQVTISVDIQTTAQSSLTDVGSVRIENSTGNAVLAEADFDASTLMLTFHVGAMAFPPIPLAINTFYRVTFSVDASDMATWKLGTGTPTTAQAFSPVMVDVDVRADWAMGTPVANPAFIFRNVLVTTP